MILRKFIEYSGGPMARIRLITAASGVPDAVAMTQWADQVLKKRLENVRGVGAVNRVGGVTREVRVALDPHRLAAGEVLNVSGGLYI